MSRSPRTSAHVRRDAALRRLRVLNRVLIGGAVAATGLLTDVTAHAFTGHKRRVTASTPGPAPVRPARTARGEARHRADHHLRHHRRAALRPPAHAPTSATTTTTTAAQARTTTPAPQGSTTSAPAPTAPAQPAPAPASSPTVSGGS